jgi:hypothetical protein
MQVVNLTREKAIEVNGGRLTLPMYMNLLGEIRDLGKHITEEWALDRIDKILRDYGGLWLR